MEKLLSKEQLAEILRVSPLTILDWVQDQKIPYVKIGRLLRFKESKIKQWIERQEVSVSIFQQRRPMREEVKS